MVPLLGRSHAAAGCRRRARRRPGPSPRVLLLTYHHAPDLGAGSFRVAALERSLREIGGPDLHLDVITTMPNRYHSLAVSAPEVEDGPGLRIRRIPLPHHRGGKFQQSRAFAAFARRVLWETRNGRWDLIFATSSRLMTAALASVVAGRAGAPLYLDIRDLFTDTMSDLLADRWARWLMPVFKGLEVRTLGRADRINLVSPAFLPSVRASAPDGDFRFFSNGVGSGFADYDFAAANAARGRPPLILYAGNIGDGQGLEHILPAAARRLDGEARFRVIGDGGRRKRLESVLAAAGVRNVEILDPMPQSALRAHYREADILFLHLNDHPVFRKVIPSKTFEYAATGKPILGGVAGYAAAFLASEVEGAEIFEPGDSAALAAAFRRLLVRPQVIDRQDFREKFALDRIMREMSEDMLSLVDRRPVCAAEPRRATAAIPAASGVRRAALRD